MLEGKIRNRCSGSAQIVMTSLNSSGSIKVNINNKKQTKRMKAKIILHKDNFSSNSSSFGILILFFFLGDFPGQAKVTFLIFFKVNVVVNFPEFFRDREIFCHRFCTCSQGTISVTLPIPLVRPSRKSSLAPGLMYSGNRMNRNTTLALSLFILIFLSGGWMASMMAD